MVSGNGCKRPYVHFVGNSSIEVTGSMHHIRFKKYSLLLDCGIIQGGDIVTSYQQNKNQIKAVKANEVDYIILSHCHSDHSGLIPAMFAKGCRALIYASEGSTPFLKLLWEDSLKIVQSDCLKIEAKHGRKASPYFSDRDIDIALQHIIEVPYKDKHYLTNDMAFTYYSAGHIIHSAQILLELREGNITKRIGYTGDIGGPTQRPYTLPREPLPFCDLLIGENTYNTATRQNNIKDRDIDVLKLEAIASEYNKILIPCFSLQRTQELLDILSTIDINCPVYLDSPLAIKFCDMWDTEWSNVHFIRDTESSKRLQDSNEHCIILAASGFMQGGRIMAHLKTALGNPNNHIIFVGYAGENNLASQIKSGQKEVIVDGTACSNQANITELRSFSSHANYEELLDYYSNDCRFNKLALVHGNYENKSTFCQTLQSLLSEQGKSARVICTNEGTKIYL